MPEASHGVFLFLEKIYFLSTLIITALMPHAMSNAISDQLSTPQFHVLKNNNKFDASLL